jgi:rRNA-processing protein FCF1
MPSAFIVIDTNSWLHYQPPNQIDWRQLIGESQVIILVPYTILQELDEKKHSSRSEVVIRRAATATKFIARALETNDLSFQFLSVSPQDWGNGSLNPMVADDRLIAELLLFQKDHSCRIVVATSDISLRVKLRAFAIEAIEIPDDYKKPDEADSKLRDLKTQVARLESARPRLTLTFDDRSMEKKISLPAEALISENDVKVRSLAQRATHYRPVPVSDAHLYDSETLAAYEFRWNTYDRLYAAFLRAKARHEYRRMVLKFAVTNVGDVHSKGISVTLTFPAGLTVTWKPIMSTLLEPALPIPPQRAGEEQKGDYPGKIYLDRYLDTALKRDSADYKWTRVLQFSIPWRGGKIKRSEDGTTSVTYTVRDLALGESKTLRAVQLDLLEPAHPFSVKWSAHAENSIGADSGGCLVSILEPQTLDAPVKAISALTPNHPIAE